MELLPYDSLMQKLRDKRRELDLKQKTVAAEAGVSAAQLSRMENGNADAKYRTVYNVWQYLHTHETNTQTAADIMHDSITWVNEDDTRKHARRTMLANAYSQLPVRDTTGDHVGSLTTHHLIETPAESQSVADLMGAPFLEVRPSTSKPAVVELLQDGNDALLVRDPQHKDYVGIITPADVV